MTDEIIKSKISKLWKEFAETEGYEWDKESKMYYIRGNNSTGMLGDILVLFHEIIGDDTGGDEIYDLITEADATPGRGFIHTTEDGVDSWDFGYPEMEMEGSVDNTRCYYTKRLVGKLVYEISVIMSPSSHTYKIRFIGGGEEKEISFDR